MSIHADIKWKLTNTGRVSDIVSGRVYPAGELPGNPVFPLITYQQISADHRRHLRGGEGIVATLIQIDCWALSHKAAADLGDAVRKTLNDIRQSTIGDPAETPVDVRAIYLDGEDQSFEQPRDNSHQSHFRHRLDFTIWHAESLTPV